MASFSSVWPDPNSAFLSKIDFGVPVAELLKWLLMRDTFLGDNEAKQDIEKALACECTHPEAVWLKSVCKGVKDVESARHVFRSLGNHPRALCFSWFFIGNDTRESDTSLLEQAVELGDRFAASYLCRLVEEVPRRFALAQKAADHNERDGFYWLGHCYDVGEGCLMDGDKAKDYHLIAAELGDVGSALALGRILQQRKDPACMYWLGWAAKKSYEFEFVNSFSWWVQNSTPLAVFIIGRTLKGNIDVEKQQIFTRRTSDFNRVIGDANHAIEFYENQIKSARLAVDTWSLVATRLRVVKDMRIYVGKMIWEGRFEANYK